MSYASRKRTREEFKVGRPHSQRGMALSMNNDQLKAYWAKIPPDDRTPAQKMLGDPPLWRSALGHVDAE